MNKRDVLLSLIDSKTQPDYIPAAFFMHFDPTAHQGQAAINKHLEFFRYTNMDFVKIQYEQKQPTYPSIRKPEDWAKFRLYSDEFFEPAIQIAKGLVQAAQNEALVIMTLYSPFMWAKEVAGQIEQDYHLEESPGAVKKGMEIMTENVLKLVRGCKRAGVDGFYASTQGGEAFRFGGTNIFQKYIKPTDLAIWDEIQSCTFNILHVCDFHGDYRDLISFLDYPGHIVNCSLKLVDQRLTPTEASQMFGRPFMGGMDRKGVISTGSPEEIRRAAEGVLADAPGQFILGADCTVLSGTPVEHIKTAIDTAHQYRR